MKRILLLVLITFVCSLSVSGQMPMESAVQLSLSYAPRSATKASAKTMSTGSLITQMGLSGGSIMCVGDAQDRTVPWVFKHRLYSKVKGQAAVETDLSEKLSMEVLGYSEVGAVKSASASAPKSTVTLGKITSTQTVKVRLLAREDARCEMWGNLVVNYSVLQEAGRLEASWVPGSISLKMVGVWAPEEGGEAGSAGLTVTMGAFKKTVSPGGVVDTSRAPAGFVLVSGGTLPDTSKLAGEVVGTFYIGKTEVTWGEWKAVRTWAVANGYSDLRNVGTGLGDSYPVSEVNWYDAVKWSNARSQKEKRTPAYTVNGAVYKSGEIDPEADVSANGYRLPSEAEWEFAARGGTKTKGYTYSGSNDLSLVGWYDGNSGNSVKEVGKKQANELGIFDMSGNLYEWSGSWYPGHEGSSRVIRGGGWYGSAKVCSVAVRYSYFPVNRDDYRLGFRVALSSVP